MKLPDLPDPFFFRVRGENLFGAPILTVEIRQRHRFLGISFSSRRVVLYAHVGRTESATEVAEVLASDAIACLSQNKRDLNAELWDQK